MFTAKRASLALAFLLKRLAMCALHHAYVTKQAGPPAWAEAVVRWYIRASYPVAGLFYDLGELGSADLWTMLAVSRRQGWHALAKHVLTVGLHDSTVREYLTDRTYERLYLTTNVWQDSSQVFEVIAKVLAETQERVWTGTHRRLLRLLAEHDPQLVIAFLNFSEAPTLQGEALSTLYNATLNAEQQATAAECARRLLTEKRQKTRGRALVALLRWSESEELHAIILHSLEFLVEMHRVLLPEADQIQNAIGQRLTQGIQSALTRVSLTLTEEELAVVTNALRLRREDGTFPPAAVAAVAIAAALPTEQLAAAVLKADCAGVPKGTLFALLQDLAI